jgi:hypothetical protein
MWMRLYPRERILLGVEKPINDDGITLDRLPSTRPRSFAIDYSRSTVYGDTLRIRKDNFTAIGNFLWIDGAMPSAQWCTVPSCVVTCPLVLDRGNPKRLKGK